MVADRRINLMYFLCVRRWMDLRPVLRRTQNLQFGGAFKIFQTQFVFFTQAVVPPIKNDTGRWHRGTIVSENYFRATRRVCGFKRGFGTLGKFRAL